MGMYTEMFVKVTLKEDVPDEVVQLLEGMVGYAEYPVILPDHPLFSKPRWGALLTCSSYYHQPFATTSFKYEDIARQWFLCSRSDLKNYDGEIEAFFDWILPYVEKLADKTFIGYSLYEEDSEPTLYYAYD